MIAAWAAGVGATTLRATSCRQRRASGASAASSRRTSIQAVRYWPRAEAPKKSALDEANRRRRGTGEARSVRIGAASKVSRSPSTREAPTYLAKPSCSQVGTRSLSAYRNRCPSSCAATAASASKSAPPADSTIQPSARSPTSGMKNPVSPSGATCRKSCSRANSSTSIRGMGTPSK